MEFVGEYLKKTRIDKKIKIGEISKELNISLYIVEKIENDDYSDDLSEVYLYGYVRSYAKYLGLDANEVIKNFKVQVSFVDKKLPIDIPKPSANNIFFNFPKSVSFFSIICIFIVFYITFMDSNDFHPNYSIMPDLPENLQFKTEEIEIRSTFNSVKPVLSKINTEALMNDLNYDNKDDKIIITQSSVNASSPVNNELEGEINKIKLKFLDSTWLQIRNNENQVIFSKLMNIEDEYYYFMRDNYTLTTGNAGNILVLINDIAKGKIGKKGEVIDSLIIDTEFNN